MHQSVAPDAGQQQGHVHPCREAAGSDDQKPSEAGPLGGVESDGLSATPVDAAHQLAVRAGAQRVAVRPVLAARRLQARRLQARRLQARPEQPARELGRLAE